MIRYIRLGVVLLAVLSTSRASAVDWPQFRCDAGRTAAGDERLPADLHLQWIRDLAPPEPAFPGNVRLEFDASYEPVVLGHTMFVPSMVTESVTALDTATGDVRWRFFAEGPVRFAPAAWQGKLYFACDDGFLYCLAVDDGRLLWKFRGLPADRNDRTLLGSGRLISLWPARGGPVVHNGVVYFAAGLWPADGVFVHALDATSGEVVWSNTDSDRIPEANQDHGIAQFAGIAPQGYLAVVGDKLVVPCGAQLPALMDLETGKLGTYRTGWGGRDGLPKGTWFVAGAGKYLCQSGDIYDLARPNDEEFLDPHGRPDFKSELYTGGLTRIRIDGVNHKDIGAFTQPVFTPEAFYENSGGIKASDLSAVRLTPRAEAELPANRQDDTYPDRFTATFKELWKLPSDLKVHIKSGDLLFCAGPGTVAAVRVPKTGDKPRLVWQAALDGTPHRMLAADGRLFVVGREGRIYAFGAGGLENVVTHRQPEPAAREADQWRQKAAQILEASQQRDGYALVLGLNSGRLVEELVRQSDLYVIAVDADADKVAQLRRRLDAAGLYGSRACVRQGNPVAYPLPPYLASLIVSELSGEVDPVAFGAIVKSVFPKLRPYGGTACLGLTIDGAGNDVSYDATTDGPLAGSTVRRSGDWILLNRAGPLPGAADWSHEAANSAGTGASTDRLVKAPLGLLWFNAPREWHRKPGSAVVRVSGGRVLIKAEKLHAIDVFTGRGLWESTLPFAHAPTDQLVATPEAIYATGGRTCIVLDPATGREARRIALPDDFPGAWANVRCWGDYLIATSGKFLFALDRRSGEFLWRRECGVASLSVAVGDGRVFVSELANARRGEADLAAAKTAALDLRSGEVVWEIGGGSEMLYSEPLDLLVTSAGIISGSDGKLASELPKTPEPVDARQAAKLPRPLFVIGDKLLWGTVESFAVLDLKTGRQEGDLTTWVRRGCTTIRASEHMVTTRVRANAAYIDLESREATSLWNIRPACLNNLYPADGVLNAPNVLGGCTCNYTHASQAYVPVDSIERASFGDVGQASRLPTSGE